MDVANFRNWFGKSDTMLNFRKLSCFCLSFSLLIPLLLFIYPTTSIADVPATELPTEKGITSGDAKINLSGTVTNPVMNITQATDAVGINWNTYNVGSAATINYIQPSSSSVAVNRVLSADPSQIFGAFNANGKVILINPAGVIFGASSKVNVGSLIASTMDMSDKDFREGKYVFSRGNSTGSILNYGTLTAADGGFVALLAPTVKNEGVIVAKMGSVASLAGEKVTLDFSGDNLIGVAVDAATVDTLVENKKAIQVGGGQVYMLASSANKLASSVVNTGSISANSVVSKGGKVYLKASRGVDSSGSIDVSGTTAGSVVIEGDNSIANITGTIDAIGSDGKGGAVNITSKHIKLLGGVRTSGDVTLTSEGSSILRAGISAKALTLNKINTAANYRMVGDRAIDIKGDLIINSGVTLTVVNDKVINVGGNWVNRGIFASGTSNVILTDSSQVSNILGNSAFYNLTVVTPGKNIIFEAGSLTTISNLLTIYGSEDKHITLTSSIASIDNKFNIYINAVSNGHGGDYLEYLDVRYSHAYGPKEILPIHCQHDYVPAELSTDWDATFTWTGGGGTSDKNWMTAANWGGTAPTGVTTDDLVFPAAGVTIFDPFNNFPTTATFRTITFSGTFSGSGYVLNGNQFTVGTGGITYASAAGAQHTINTPIALSAATTTVKVTNASNTLVIGGTISGAGSLTKTGAGMLTLTGANSYSGTTTVSAGVLNAQNATALGASTGVVSVTSGAALQIQGGITVAKTAALTLRGGGIANSGALRNILGNNIWSGPITLASATVIGSDAGALTVSGVINQTGGGRSLTKVGVGTLVLSGTNTYTGLTAVNAGVLSFSGAITSGASGNLGNASSAIVLGTATTKGTLSYIGTSAAAFARPITVSNAGGGQVVASNTGALTISTGAVTLSSTGIFTLSAVSTGGITVSSIISGAGGVTVNSAGTGLVILSGANTYTGDTTVSAGILNIQNGSALGASTGVVSVTSGAALQIQGGITVTKTAALTLNGTGISNGGALRNISGANIWSGPITLGSATRINSDTGGTTLTIRGGIAGAGYALTMGGIGDITVDTAAITGTGTAITKDGVGTLLLSFANSYTGLTTVSAGTLTIIGNESACSGGVTINAGTLNINSTTALGTGSFTLGGGNTVAGSDFFVGGSWTNNGGAFTPDTYTVTFNGGASQTIGGTSPTTFNNLTINNTSGVALSNNITVGSILTLTAGAFKVGANTLTLNGPTIAGTPANLITAATSSLVFGGSSSGVDIPSSVTALNALTINNSNNVALNSDITLTTFGGIGKLQVAIKATCSACSKIYDGTLAHGSVIFSLSSYSINNDASVMAYNSSGVLFNSKDVATANTITVSGISLSGGNSSRYAVFPTSTSFNASITQLGIVVTPDSGQTKVYSKDSSTDPTFTYTNTPALKTGDSFTGKLDRAAGEDVGSYAIGLGTLSAGGNYSLTLTPVNFSITKRNITGSFITNTSKTYDGSTSANVLSRTLTGVISPDVVSLVGGTATYNSKDVSTATTVILSGASLIGAAAGNYNLASVTPVSATIIAKAVSLVGTRAYDGTSILDKSIFTIEGIIGTETLTTTGGGLMIDKNVGTNKPVTLGSLALDNGTGKASNYALIGGTHLVTITEKSLTITADDKKIVSGSDIPPLTVRYNGFVGGEDESVVSDLKIATIATKYSAVGQYQITPYEAVAPNYNITFVPGMLTISVAEENTTPNPYMLNSGIIESYLDNLTSDVSNTKMSIRDLGLLEKVEVAFPVYRPLFIFEDNNSFSINDEIRKFGSILNNRR